MSLSFSPKAVRRDRSPLAINNVLNKPHNETMPLIETKPAPPPPIAGPEIDDLDDDTTQAATNPYPGIDDGFFTESEMPDVENIPSLMPRIGPEDDEKAPPRPPIDVPDVGNNIPQPERPHFPYAPGYRPNEVEFGGIPDYESIPDINVYQHKKTLAQGMMDLALFSANANQLRYVIESYERHPYYYPSLIMISLSLLLQIAIGIGLILNSRYNVKDEKEICIANKISNYTIIGIFIVTSVNVFISAFGVAPAPAPTLPP